jgi:general secretion pathway protein N
MSVKKIWLIVALGIGAYLLFALITLPAQVVLSRLQSSGVQAAGVEGTAWRGSAQVLQVRGVNVGRVEWNLHVLKLFTGRIGADVRAKRADGSVQTRLTVTPSGRLDFEQLTASLPLEALAANVISGGWRGGLSAELSLLTLEDGWPTAAQGTIEAREITGPARNPANIGSYKISLPEGSAKTPGMLVGALSDMGGPLQIAGIVQLKNDKSYLVEGTAATRADTPRDVAKALEYLGPPDAQGRRQFSLSGTL